jgi:hypothetical protein
LNPEKRLKSYNAASHFRSTTKFCYNNINTILSMLLIEYPNWLTTSYTTFSLFFQHQRWFVLESCPKHDIRFSLLFPCLSSLIPFSQKILTLVLNFLSFSTNLCFYNAINTKAYQNFSFLSPKTKPIMQPALDEMLKG